MIHVEISDLDERIDELLDLVETEEKICITRSDEIVAMLVPCDGTE